MVWSDTYDRDVFISYSWFDNEPLLPDGGRGWVSTFYFTFERLFKMRFAEEPEIYFDQSEVQGNHSLNPEVLEKASKSAVLITILSPRYLKSEWCMREREAFIAGSKSRSGQMVGNQSRIFKVLKTAIPREQQPEALRDLPGYNLFLKDHETGRIRGILPLTDNKQKKFFVDKMGDLVEDIKRLYDADIEPPNEDSSRSTTANRSLTIYLSECIVPLIDERDKIRRDLSQHNIRILPENPLVESGDQVRTTILALLKESDIVVHLIGQHHGWIPEGENKPIDHLQVHLASQVRQSNQLIQFFRVSPLGMGDAPQQRAFIQSLQSNRVAVEGAELFQGGISDLMDSLRASISEPKKESASGISAKPVVYFICDKADMEEQDAPTEVLKYLDAEGFEVTWPPFDSKDQSSYTNAHLEALKRADGVLFYYGAGSELWLRKQREELLKAQFSIRQDPLKAIGIFLAPPRNSNKRFYSILRRQGEIIIDCLRGWSPDLIEPFIRQLYPG